MRGPEHSLQPQVLSFPLFFTFFFFQQAKKFKSRFRLVSIISSRNLTAWGWKRKLVYTYKSRLHWTRLEFRLALSTCRNSIPCSSCMPAPPHTAFNALNLVFLPQGTSVVYASAGTTHVYTIPAPTYFTTAHTGFARILLLSGFNPHPEVGYITRFTRIWINLTWIQNQVKCYICVRGYRQLYPVFVECPCAITVYVKYKKHSLKM